MAIETEAQGTDSPITPNVNLSPRDQALAMIDDLEWTGEGVEAAEQVTITAIDKDADAITTDGGDETDELAVFAKKIEERRAAAAQAKAQPKGPTFDQAAFLDDPRGYLATLGLDSDALLDALADDVIADPQARQTKAQARELERLRAAEKHRSEQALRDRQASEERAMETEYTGFVQQNAAKFPRLAALEPNDQIVYTSEVARLVVDAGADADAAELARLTELHLSKLARRLTPGAGTGSNSKAEVGGRTQSSADSDAPRTITNQLLSESGTPPERDLSPEGRRAAALREAARLGM